MGILLNYFSHKKFRYHQRKVILFYTLDFAFCSCKIKFKKNEEGEKRITRAVAMQKMPPPHLYIESNDSIAFWGT